MATKKNKLKIYKWVSKHYNSNSQEGEIIVVFKAESLKQLDSYIFSYQKDDNPIVPKARLKVKEKLPKNFYEAGGFCSKDISFICVSDKTDMKEWWNASGLGFIK